MKQVLSIAVLVLPFLSACGENEEQPYFQVGGEARIEKEAELFKAEMSVSERAKDRMESLKAVSAKLDDITDKLSRLKGLDSLTLTTSNARTETVRPTGCEREGSYRQYQPYPENCAPIDFVSIIKVEIEGAPAEAAGPALSLVTELKAESATLTGFDVKDRKAAELEARAKAIEDASATAQVLAERTGSKMGAPLRVEYEIEPSYRTNRVVARAARPRVETLEKGDPRYSPSVLLDVPPDKVIFLARVTVHFALEKPKPEK